MSGKATSFVRYLAYAMEIAVVFTLGNTPGLLPEIYGAKPALLLCVALTAAVYEREVPAMVIGISCGALMDLGYSNSIGVFTISLAVVCFIVGYAANNLIMATFPNFFIYSLITVGGIFMLYFLIYFVLSGTGDMWLYFSNHLISRMTQTFVCSFIFYFLNRLVHNLLGEESV